MTDTTGGAYRLDFLGVLLDASADTADIDINRCGAAGPNHDKCARDRGHTDGGWFVGIHAGFASAQYQEWPVGWRPAADRIATILDPGFGDLVTGTPDYVQGFADAVHLIRQVLAPAPNRKHQSGSSR